MKNKSQLITSLVGVTTNMFYNTFSHLRLLSQEELDKLHSLMRRGKNKGDNSGQYGYYITPVPHFHTILNLTKKYKITGIVDLGAGAGHFVSIMNTLGVRTRGIELEPTLVTLANALHSYVGSGDILKPILLRDNENAVYFYEPMFARELQEKFVKNLEESLNKGQYIIYTQAGSTGIFLEDSKYFRELNSRNKHSSVRIFRKMK